jgi:hypothetical protein
MMDELKVQRGLVGYFDILGFKNLVMKNDVDAPMREVLKLINSSEEALKRHFRWVLGNSSIEENRRLEGSIQRTKWLMVSDSILIFLPCETIEFYDWIAFHVVAIHFLSGMFLFGLPLRGAITIGEFMIYKSCYAGRAIVNAYNAASRLMLAGCVSASPFPFPLPQIPGRHPAEEKESLDRYTRIIIEYKTPVKNKDKNASLETVYENLSLLNYWLFSSELLLDRETDTDRMVFDRFCAWKKDLADRNAGRKRAETERFVNFVKDNKLFWTRPAEQEKYEEA